MLRNRQANILFQKDKMKKFLIVSLVFLGLKVLELIGIVGGIFGICWCLFWIWDKWNWIAYIIAGLAIIGLIITLWKANWDFAKELTGRKK